MTALEPQPAPSLARSEHTTLSAGALPQARDLALDYLDSVAPAPRMSFVDAVGMPNGEQRPGGRLSNRGERQDSGWTYVASAALHPANLFVVLVTLLLLARHPGFDTLALGLAIEAAFLAMTPRCASFRRAVQRSLDEEALVADRQERGALMLKMADGHRKQLLHLEGLLAEAHATTARRRCLAMLTAGDAPATDRLTLGYIHLAVEHRASTLALSMMDESAIHARVASLEALASGPPGPMDPIFGRWLALARRRAARSADTRVALDTIAIQLATITEIVHLMHQESLATSVSCPSDVDMILADLDHGEDAAREIAEMGLAQAGPYPSDRPRRRVRGPGAGVTTARGRAS